MANPQYEFPSADSLRRLVDTDFTGNCNRHTTQTGSAKRANLYCIRCAFGPLCVDCTTDHVNHAIIKVYIAKHQPTLRVHDFGSWPRLLDDIQCHQFSFSDHIYLTQPPRPPSKASVCEGCNLKLQLSYRFCSLRCKLLSLTRQRHNPQGTSTSSQNVASTSQGIQHGLESLPGTYDTTHASPSSMHAQVGTPEISAGLGTSKAKQLHLPTRSDPSTQKVAGTSQGIQHDLESLPGINDAPHASPSSMDYQQLHFPTRQGVDQHGTSTSTHHVGFKPLPGSPEITVGLGTSEITDPTICTTRKQSFEDVGTPEMSAGLGTSKVIAPDICTSKQQVNSDGLDNVHDHTAPDGVGTSPGVNHGFKTMIVLSEETDPKITSEQAVIGNDSKTHIDPESSPNKEVSFVKRIARSLRPFRWFKPY